MCVPPLFKGTPTMPWNRTCRRSKPSLRRNDGCSMSEVESVGESRSFHDFQEFGDIRLTVVVGVEPLGLVLDAHEVLDNECLSSRVA